jgi:hypothetical protein
VGRTVYYCQVSKNHTPEFPKGIISIPFKQEYITKIKRCISYSEKVWVQGSRGGVKVIKDRETDTGPFGYVTRDDNEMKKFMWAKLKAKSLAHYN